MPLSGIWNELKKESACKKFELRGTGKLFGGSIAQHQTTLVIQILAKSAKARPKVS